MNIDNIIVGQKYKVTAPGTTNREWWEVVTKKQNKLGDWEITCTKPGAASSRIFRPEHFKDMKKKGEIISTSTELVDVIDGLEIWVEEVEYMPDHKRRGRKPKEAVTA